MAKTTTKPCQDVNAKAQPGLPPVYQHLYSLLHTLRSLESHQDQICTLLADIQRTGKTGPGVQRELKALLHDLPSGGLDAEVRAVWSALEAA